MTAQYSTPRMGRELKPEGPHLRDCFPFRERFGDVTTPIPAGEEAARPCGDGVSAIRDGVNVAALAAASTMI